MKKLLNLILFASLAAVIPTVASAGGGTEPPANSEKSEKSEKSKKSEKSEKSKKSEKSEKSAKSEKSKKSEKSVKSAKSVKSVKYPKYDPPKGPGGKNVPDSGATLGMLGLAILGFALLRRKLSSK